MPYKDPDMQRAAQAAWRRRNPSKARAASKAWRERNREHVRAYQAKYDKDYPERARAKAAARRARKLAQFVEDVDPLVVLVRDAGICGICLLPIEGDYHLDHIMPLSRGGEHSYANIQLAHPPCNIRKGNRV